MYTPLTDYAARYVLHVMGLMSVFYELRNLVPEYERLFPPIRIFEQLCSCKFKAEMLVNKLHFLDNMIFTEGASLKGASSHLDCLLKYLC